MFCVCGVGVKCVLIELPYLSESDLYLFLYQKSLKRTFYKMVLNVSIKALISGVQNELYLRFIKYLSKY